MFLNKTKERACMKRTDTLGERTLNFNVNVALKRKHKCINSVAIGFYRLQLTRRILHCITLIIKNY